MLQFIIPALIKAVLGLILDRVSPKVKAAMDKGMDEVRAEPNNKMDEVVLNTFQVRMGRDISGVNAPIDTP